MGPPNPFKAPRPLKLGDAVRIIAPAGPFDRALFWRGAGWLAEHFRVQWSPGIFCRDGFVAGKSSHRLNNLLDALDVRECRALICARGGVGSAEVAALLPPSVLSRNPKWLVGFSDITALHCAYQREQIMSLHAPNVTSLGLGSAALRESWLHAVLNPLARQDLTVDVLLAGSAHGPLVGGNLAVLHDLCAADEWLPPQGAVLFVEDVGEPPYRIHRMLTAMARRGITKRLSGVVFGQISASHPGRHGVTAREVCQRFCEEQQLPAAWGIPAGHEPNENLPLTLGASARLLLPVSGPGLLELNSLSTSG